MDSINFYDNSHASRFLQILDQRELQLRAILRTSNDSTDDGFDPQTHEVTDFKDMAQQENSAVLDQAQGERASNELTALVSARARIGNGTYGICQACGESIDMRRLETLPTASYCHDCQIEQERLHVSKRPEHRPILHLPK